MNLGIKLIAVCAAIAIVLTQTVIADNADDSHADIVLAQSGRVVKQTTCPREIKVGSVRNTGDWVLPATQAAYAEVKVKKRPLGPVQAYTAVCYYSAYRGKVAIERVLGEVSEFRTCEVAQFGSRGGAKCFAW
jgi:hypothetical protein